MTAAIGSSYLTVSNNLSDLANPSTARSNLGLGSAAVLNSTAVFQVANNLNEVANAATARTNLGAASSASPTITGGMTYSGQTKGNVHALSANDIDVSVGEFFTKSINSNTTFTVSNVTASKVQGFFLALTISSSAVPTWFAAVKWEGGVAPTLANGLHLFSFLTYDGGTTWIGSLVGTELA